jgi:protein-disulfide isomerase
MTTILRRSTLVLAFAAVAISGCNKDKETKSPDAAPAAGAGLSDSTPVVRYAGKTVTVKDIDATIASQLKQLDKQKLELRQQTGEQLAIQAMVKDEATKAGSNEEAWLKANIDGKLPTPDDAAIKKVFEENKDKMPPGSTIESMREQIVGFLNQDARRTAALKLFEDLKAKNKYEMLLEEPRVTVAATGPAKGPADAKITIVEFSDFECPYCSKAEESVTEVMDHYAGKVRVVYRYFPLSFHPHAQKAAEAAACADEQGKFWEMHKTLFANQQKLAVEDLKAHAATVGLDAAKFAECLDKDSMKAKVDGDQKAGAEAGVNGTPAFFINGRVISGAQPFAEFEKIINAELAKGG